MCGFAGVISWDERYRVSRETLAKMSAAIAHRGPDGEGTYFSPDAEITPDRPQVALAHRRLAIIDPDPRANQPFTDNHGRWLVFNGEIYNFRDLRAELKTLKPDYEWRTDCDTEVLLIAYDVWGEKCVEHFNGMFAFAIWDGVKGELFLARDRMGQKPLYFASGDDGRSVAFASELQGLRPLSWLDRSIRKNALAGYLRFGYVGSSDSIHAGAQQLLPGHWMRCSGAAVETVHYFREAKSSESADSGAAVTARRLIEQAVQRQLISDVPLGCFLSGGMDSSVIAATMKAAGGEVETFSIGFDDARYDESEYAQSVAAHLKTRHHRFKVSPDAAADLPTLAATFGEPFGDSSALATHYLARETRRHVKVALSGDGGDELFGGYDRYRALHAERFLRRVPRVLRERTAAYVSEQLPDIHPKSLSSRMRRFLQSANLQVPQRYDSYMRLFQEEQLHDLLAEPLEADEPIAALMQAMGERPVVEAALATDRVTYLPDDLLTKVDRASMLHALEVRSPFMDHELVQFAAGLTTEQLLKGGPKRMLREAFADDLPAWVFKRKKMGFAVPIGEWFRKDLRPMLHDNLFASDSFGASHFNMNVVRRLVDEHESMRVDHSQRLYALLMLELWWKSTKH